MDRSSMLNAEAYWGFGSEFDNSVHCWISTTLE